MDVFLVYFILCLTAAGCEWRVTYSSKQVCGLKGASVVLPCRYYYPWQDTYQGGEWTDKQKMTVKKHINLKYPDCSLNLDRLLVSQSGVYSFKFYTALHYNWITNPSGVALSITDLQVMEDAVGNQTKVTCRTSCSLGSKYVWYWNGQLLQGKTTKSILLDPAGPSEKGDYSCAVTGYEAHRSPAVCAPKKQCWAVTYSSTSICALLGSSVDIPCTYKYPGDHRIKKTHWFHKQKSNEVCLNKECKDHVEYLGNKENNCTLRVKGISESQAGEYGFKFLTEKGMRCTGLPVNISVTGLQVAVSSTTVTEGESVTLTCRTTCTLGGNPTFTWFKNSVIFKHTTDRNLHFEPVQGHDSGNYSCAVRGHENISSTDVFLNVRYAIGEQDGAWTVKAGIIIFMILALILALGIMILWKCTNRAQHAVESAQNNPNMVYDSITGPSGLNLTEEVGSYGWGEVQYASLRFSRAYQQEESLNSAAQKDRAAVTRPEDDCVVYSDVRNLPQH